MIVFLVVLGVAVVAVALIVVVVANKKKRKKGFEELKNGKAYELAVKIKDEVEKKGRFHFGEPKWEWKTNAYGTFDAFSDGFKFSCIIYFSESLEGALSKELRDTQNANTNHWEGWIGHYYLKNEKIGIAVRSHDDSLSSRGVPESIEIAIAVIEDNGYGQSVIFRPWK
jgi:hypothetical protein